MLVLLLQWQKKLSISKYRAVSRSQWPLGGCVTCINHYKFFLTRSSPGHVSLSHLNTLKTITCVCLVFRLVTVGGGQPDLPCWEGFSHMLLTTSVMSVSVERFGFLPLHRAEATLSEQHHIGSFHAENACFGIRWQVLLRPHEFFSPKGSWGLPLRAWKKHSVVLHIHHSLSSLWKCSLSRPCC